MIISCFKTPACVALLTVSLSACAQMGLDEAAAPPPPVSADVPAGQAPLVRSPARSAGDLKALRPAARPVAEKEKEVAALPAIPPKLVGLSEGETSELLGPPAEENAEPPGKVWVYKVSGCKLSVHLFPDMEKGGFYALDYTADGARDLCLGKVAGEARRKG